MNLFNVYPLYEMTPSHANMCYVFDKKGEKIMRFWWADNTAVWQKWNLSKQTIKNGTIYKDHPNLGKVRLVYYNVEQGDLEATFENFSKNARIYDSNLVDKEYNSLEDHIQNVGAINLSEKAISDDMALLLAKGPSFPPTPKYVNWKLFFLDFETFVNRLRRKELFFQNSLLKEKGDGRASCDINIARFNVDSAAVP